MMKRTLLVGPLVVLLAVGFCVPYFGDDLGPEAPTGLALIVGVDWVDLSWNASSEPDLADEDGYRLYRRELEILDDGTGDTGDTGDSGDSGDSGDLGDTEDEVEEPEFPGDYDLIAKGMGTWFHDETVQSGVIYEYVLTVRDIDGNESAPSDKVDTIVTVYGPGSGSGGGGCFLSMAR